MKEFYNGYTITSGFIGKKSCFYVDNALIFLTVEEAKKFCDIFTDKKELCEMISTL